MDLEAESLRMMLREVQEHRQDLLRLSIALVRRLGGRVELTTDDLVAAERYELVTTDDLLTGGYQISVREVTNG